MQSIEALRFMKNGSAKARNRTGILEIEKEVTRAFAASSMRFANASGASSPVSGDVAVLTVLPGHWPLRRAGRYGD